mmetsp:Transcript_82835/g.230443  ORF Transcript_82835/g.230443 Transcript_82835/m.230443 type:complete len:256 (+) Transcript_82835:3-770(+)
MRDPVSLVRSFLRHSEQFFTPHADTLHFMSFLNYRALIKIVLAWVPKDRVLVVPTAALSRDPAGTYRRILRFLNVSAPARLARQALVHSRHVWNPSQSICTMLGKCMDLCDERFSDVRALLKELYSADTRLLDGYLARHGWAPELRGLEAKTCATPPKSHFSNEGDGLCISWGLVLGRKSSECFASREACLSCCVRHEGDCADFYEDRWRECCEDLALHINHMVRSALRREVCPRGMSPGGCCVGFGHVELEHMQ